MSEDEFKKEIKVNERLWNWYRLMGVSN
jgi:hypothetical protein